MKFWNLFLLFWVTLATFSQHPFNNPELPVQQRIDNLISLLTLEEKASQLLYNAPAIERLGIPAYNWWNEALHGVGRSGRATIFPQAIGMAATFDAPLVEKVAATISDEARAKFNAAQAQGNRNQYTGLTFWTPNVNIFRDPRWGRGQETYGEDPFLTSQLGIAFVKGLQGDDPNYLKTAACAKHYAVHSGPEKLRHEFNAMVNQKDLHETYLPAFKALVDAGVESVMCAYNRTNDEPCCASNSLLNDILIKDWQFKGHILSDCWALVDFYSENGHGTVKTAEEGAALALKSGVSLNCGSTYQVLAKAVQQGLVEETVLDKNLATLLRTRFKLGLMDPQENVPFSTIPVTKIDADEHRALSLEVATKSMVLLKNNGVLPLEKDLNRYYVVGPNAASVDALLGNYFGVNPNIVTFLEGITNKVAMGSQVQYSPGTTLDRANVNPFDWSSGGAADADVTIAVLGLTRHIEGEEGESISSPYFGDRLDYNVPQNQLDYLQKLASHNKPLVAIVTGGCPMNLSEIHELADAVLLAWYPGEEGGNAAASLLFGDTSPSGRLPITFPKSLDQLPPYEDYSMKGRTYRYMEKEPMYPFGFGLGYSEFTYDNIILEDEKIKTKQETKISCTVTNTGAIAADEIVQFYVTDNESTFQKPLFSLRGTQRIHLEPGGSKTISFSVTPEDLALINEKGIPEVETGQFTLYIGGNLPSVRSMALGGSEAASIVLQVK
ncbi:MAG: glycoside hydrolase family 3 C-terminal domain-containing protein [Bacteroidota bacterium]